MEYATAEQMTPALVVEIAQGDRRQRSGPVVLPRTYWWACSATRSAALGEFEITPGMNQITLTLQEKAAVNLFSLWLVRLPSAPPPEPQPFSFDNLSYSANRISLTANLLQEGFVLLNEIHYPGWEAFLDGKPAEIFRADGIFRALLVPAGSHQIELRFRPRHFAWGAAVSALTLLCFLAYGALYRRRSLLTKR